MKKFTFFEKPAAAKTVYIMAGVSFCLAAIAVGVLYSQTMSKVEKNLTTAVTTRQAGRNQTGETDPRYSTAATQSTTATTETTTFEVEENHTQITTAQAPVIATTAKEKQSFMLPCDGKIIREYSPTVPLYCETMEDWRTHNGVDFAVGEDEEVLSVGKGKVSKVLADASYGYIIEVDYGEFTARYCGMKQGSCVGINQLLNKGDSIGQVAQVPCESKQGSHLHFEIVKDGDYIDPMKITG